MSSNIRYLEQAYRSGRTVIFDLDDTIFPELSFLIRQYTHVSKTFFGDDWETPFQYLLKEFTINRREGLFDRFVETYDIDVPVCKVLEVFRSYPQSRGAYLTPYSWFRTLADQLGRKYPLLIITNGYPLQQKEKIRALEIDDFFDVIFCIFANEFRPKPASDALYEMEKSFDLVRPIYVGDSITDKEFSRASGIEFFDVGMLRG